MMSDAEKALLAIIAPPLKAAGYSRRRRVWSRVTPETALIVEVLCQSGPPFRSCCTIEFGVALCGTDGGRLGIAGALLRDRWGHLLTSVAPWTDWWVGFDAGGPYLTACGRHGERLDAEAPRRALEGTIIPVLERCSTLEAIESVLRNRVDWVTGSKLQNPGADRWCETSLARLGRLRSAPPGGHQWETTSVEDLVALIEVESTGLDRGGPTMDNEVPDFVVTFGDELAHGYEEDVVETIRLVRQTPGVRSADHADREVIAGWGRPDLETLEARIRAWWKARLSEDQ
jgi:hypothetical protein